MDDTRSNEYFKLPLLPFSISLSQQLCGAALQRAFYQWLQIYLSCITIAAENVSMHLIYFAGKKFLFMHECQSKSLIDGHIISM